MYSRTAHILPAIRATILGQFASGHLVAKRFTFEPLRDDVGLISITVRENLQKAGMIQELADLLLAVEALRENPIGLRFRVRDLDSDLVVCNKIRCAESGGVTIT